MPEIRLVFHRFCRPRTQSAAPRVKISQGGLDGPHISGRSSDSHGGRESLLLKRDVGYGQGPGQFIANGQPYRLDVWWRAAKQLGVSKSAVRVQLAPGTGAASTLGVLPEVVKAVNGKVPVLFDGGVRRGTDVFKALALGASAVGIGRPYCWGLAAFGQPGVDRVLALMQDEFVIIMRQAGTLDIAAINAQYLTPATRPVQALRTDSGRKYDLAD